MRQLILDIPRLFHKLLNDANGQEKSVEFRIQFKIVTPLIFKIAILYLFTFGCAGSSLKCMGFLALHRVGACSRVAICGLLIVVVSLVLEHGL